MKDIKRSMPTVLNYLIATADHLPDTKGEGKQIMLTCLTILGNTSFKPNSGGVNDKNCTVSL